MAEYDEWKSEEYHGYAMHVRAQPRAVENPELPGHGEQWDFIVHITPAGESPDAAQHDTARSDPGIFYSTRSIAENMGFLKGRELIEGRVTNRAGETRDQGRVL